MSGKIPANPGDHEAWINELLDGELDEAAAQALKAAAAEDSVLARAIVDAWQLQKGMDQIQLEKAPASLSRKLKRIPQQQRAALRGSAPGLSRWVMAAGLASLVVAVALTLMMDPARRDVAAPQPFATQAETDAARVAQTRRDLATAFFYLDKVGLRLGHQINEVLNDELSAPVKHNLIKHMPFTGASHKEKHV